jgi:hypothetical protein
MNHETLTFKIRQDGKVNLEVNGVLNGTCINITKDIEEALGLLQTREFKPHYYQSNVALHHNKNQVQV